LLEVLGGAGMGVDGSGGEYGDGEEGGGEGEEGGEGEAQGGFSDLLADAILKRPESICGGSFRSAKREKEKARAEDVGGSGSGRKDEARERYMRDGDGDGDADDDGWIRNTSSSLNGFKKPMASVSVGDEG